MFFPIKSMPSAEFSVSALVRAFSYNQPNKYSNMAFHSMISMRFDKAWDSTVTGVPDWGSTHTYCFLYIAEQPSSPISSSHKVQNGPTHIHKTLGLPPSIAWGVSALLDAVLEALTGAPTGKSTSQCVCYITFFLKCPVSLLPVWTIKIVDLS